MTARYCCKNPLRLNEVRDRTKLQGIQYLEVGPDQKTLRVYLIPDPYKENGEDRDRPVPALETKNVVILGGVRVPGAALLPVADGESAVVPGRLQVESVSVNDYILTVVVNQPGDFSTYTLRLVRSSTDLRPPDPFDVRLSEIDFGFKVNCPSEFDCAAERECPAERPEEPEIDYLAKDYASFRRLMLDRLSVIMPDWKERNPADLQMALVEVLAYVGDHLSYLQDAVASEAYLGTARKRISVRRHARLLDYPMHDGCNARTWVCMEIEKGGDAESHKLPPGTRLLTKGGTGKCGLAEADLERILREEKPIVYETMHEVTLHSSQNVIHFHTWGDSECCLPKGSTRATLRNDPDLFLASGDVLLLEEIRSPGTGAEAEADPARRHVVRIKTVEPPSEDPLDGTKVLDIEWHEADALPFPLCVTALVTDPDGKKEIKEVSVARGNIVLADHGLALPGRELRLPADEPVEGYCSLVLPDKDISLSVPYSHEGARKEPASTIWLQDPRKALPSRMTLTDANESWEARRDLLESSRFHADFAVEIEAGGEAILRFGNGVTGKKPSAGTAFTVTYRIGNGGAGNVGPGAIARIVTDLKDIQAVRNPLPARGGTDAETMEQVRQFAPHAFRTQERAVTEEDYAEVTERHPEVQKAAATFRWTGSWDTAFITVDRKGGWPVDAGFKAEMLRHLEMYRLAGYDLEVEGPVFVPLDILITVCVKAGYLKSHVKKSLLKAFSSFDLPGGQRGFFHPDNFTFGQPVYLSKIYQCAMMTAGVASVRVLKFQRWGITPQDEIDTGCLKPGRLEVVRLDNDPNFPENGKIDFRMQGGI